MKPFVTAAVGALILAIAAPALAQPTNWDLHRREKWLQERIDRGVADGSLDRVEAHRVQNEMISIQRQEDAMRNRPSNYGHLTDRDRDVLNQRLDDLNARIHWLRHNDEVAPWRH